MRLRPLLVVAVLALPLGPLGAAVVDSVVPLVPRACTQDAVMDPVRPAACQRTLYRYGPLTITPGDNLILAGPVTIEKPAIDGSIVRFRPDLTFATGDVPAIEQVHLHHAVWISTAFNDPIFASGEEKTIFTIPNGYGIPVRALGEAWLLNYMVHNQTATTF